MGRDVAVRIAMAFSLGFCGVTAQAAPKAQQGAGNEERTQPSGQEESDVALFGILELMVRELRGELDVVREELSRPKE